jgi:hypothetical protein
MREEPTRYRNSVNEVGERCHEVYRQPGGGMTSAELRSELGRIQSAFSWCLVRGAIRGRLKTDKKKRVFDPITAIVFFRTGTFLPEGRWSEAAELIGLQHSDCADIVAACNYTWDPSCRQGRMRQEFLNLVMPELGEGGFVVAGLPREEFSLESQKRIPTPTH